MPFVRTLQHFPQARERKAELIGELRVLEGLVVIVAAEIRKPEVVVDVGVPREERVRFQKLGYSRVALSALEQRDAMDEADVTIVGTESQRAVEPAIDGESGPSWSMSFPRWPIRTSTSAHANGWGMHAACN